MDQPSAYNIIIDCPTLNQLKAITSTYHMMMKFPTEKEIAIMLGDQSMVRMCYIQRVDGKMKGKMVSTVFQLGDKFPCKIEEGGTFGELDQRDDVERQKVETPNC